MKTECLSKAQCQKRMPHALGLAAKKEPSILAAIADSTLFGPGEFLEAWAESAVWCIYYPTKSTIGRANLRDGGLLGESIHTVLRKYVMGDFERVAQQVHNIISNMTRDRWGYFLDTAERSLFRKVKP